MSPEEFEKAKEIIRKRAANRPASLVARPEIPPVPFGNISPPPCVFRGRATGQTLPCDVCGKGKLDVPLLACSKFGVCTVDKAVTGENGSPVQSCRVCRVREGPRIERRHLVYHLLPVTGNGVWRRSIDQLRARWDLFTGKKVIAIATGGMPGGKLDSPSDVRDYLPGNCEVIEIRNESRRREVASWIPLWSRVLIGAGDNDAVFYGHTKGSTRPVDPGNSCQWWASLLYSLCLDHWPLVARQLADYGITGPFKKIGRCFTGSNSTWHYSGTFFWVRVGDFLTRKWRTVDQKWWGAEAWPGLAYRSLEAGTIFMGGPQSEMDIYDPNLWANRIRPEYALWLKQNPPAWSFEKVSSPSNGSQ